MQSSATARLGHREVWGLPNFGPPKGDRFGRLRIEYRQGQEAPASMRSKTGWSSDWEPRAPLLRAALTDLMIGQNDFGIVSPADRRADAGMFW